MRRPLPSLLQLSRMAIQQSLAWHFSASPVTAVARSVNTQSLTECASAAERTGLPNSCRASDSLGPPPTPVPSSLADPSASSHTSSTHHPEFTLIDGTCGNGHDTLFLAQTSSQYLDKDPKAGIHLLAFDVQKTAIVNTKQRLERHCFPKNLHISYLHKGHEQAANHCPHNAPPILAVYNLGFLPGSDKTVTTSPRNSLASFQGLLPLLAYRGMLVIHAYGGHEGGMNEVEAVRQWAKGLPEQNWTARCYETITPVKNPESLFIIEKSL